MKVKREQRLNSEFQREIYDILKNKVKNHDITEMFSILEVDVTNDLKYAKYLFRYIQPTKKESKKLLTLFAIAQNSLGVNLLKL